MHEIGRPCEAIRRTDDEEEHKAVKYANKWRGIHPFLKRIENIRFIDILRI